MKVYVVGVGMTKFEKPGKLDWDYPEIGKLAAQRALNDACIDYDCIDTVCAGYCYGDSTCGQRVVYQLGMTGIPVYNVNNNCATGSSALHMGKTLVQGGVANCVLAVGFEKMERGSLGSKYTDRTNPLDIHVQKMMETTEYGGEPMAPWMFASAGQEYMEKFGATKTHLAKIAYKNHKHSKHNPYAQFRHAYTMEEIKNSKLVSGAVTKLQCCPTSDGGAAAVIANEAFVIKHGLQGQAVEIVGMSMMTDLPTTFNEPSLMKQVGFDMTKQAASTACQQAGISPKQIDVVELHDCFSANEMLTYDALGICDHGKAAEFIDQNQNTFGGTCVVNPSGGLISKGHPLGATGIAQCAEMVWQIRNEAGPRQVQNCKYALSHNLGLGGAVIVTIYHKPTHWQNQTPKRASSGAMGFPPAARL